MDSEMIRALRDERNVADLVRKPLGARNLADVIHRCLGTVPSCPSLMR